MVVVYQPVSQPVSQTSQTSPSSSSSSFLSYPILSYLPPPILPFPFPFPFATTTTTVCSRRKRVSQGRERKRKRRKGGGKKKEKKREGRGERFGGKCFFFFIAEPPSRSFLVTFPAPPPLLLPLRLIESDFRMEGKAEWWKKKSNQVCFSLIGFVLGCLLLHILLVTFLRATWCFISRKETSPTSSPSEKNKPCGPPAMSQDDFNMSVIWW